MLFLGTVLQAQSFDFSCTETPMFGGYENLETIDDYVDAFVADAASLGHEVSFQEYLITWPGNENDQTNYPHLSDSGILWPNITLNDNNQQVQIIAQGAISCSGGSDIIRVSREWWNHSDTTWQDKLKVVYHELGHSYVRLKHTTGTCKIMTSGVPTSCFVTDGEVNDAWQDAVANMLDKVKQVSACKSNELKIINN